MNFEPKKFRPDLPPVDLHKPQVSSWIEKRVWAPDTSHRPKRVMSANLPRFNSEGIGIIVDGFSTADGFYCEEIEAAKICYTTCSVIATTPHSYRHLSSRSILANLFLAGWRKCDGAEATMVRGEKPSFPDTG